jgi:hypothetical protein
MPGAVVDHVHPNLPYRFGVAIVSAYVRCVR